MRLGILGPLLVTDDTGREIAVPAPRQRTLLATLLVRANGLVSADELADIVWDGTPPTGAARTVRSYMARLRRVVGPDVAARITTRDPGYRCQLSEDELDVLRFEALCREGGAAARAGQWRRADSLLGEALGLWRGAVLADVASTPLHQECAQRLEQARAQALERRIDAGLQLGWHEQLLPEIESLARSHPLREHIHAQLMLALYRSGRQAEALEAFQGARRVLVAELGVEPGAELRELQRRILVGDPVLTASAPEPDARQDRATAADRPAEAPCQLPPAVGHFAGRETELASLTALLTRAGAQRQPAMVISAIDGTPGVGKTELALQWAHRVADRFPDGQLYADLRGHDAGEPLASHDALAGFLRALGVDGHEIAAEPSERTAQYRSVLTGRRVLVMLDNARDAEQVRPLLPGAPSCFALVTGRNRLAGLVARDGAVRLDLDVLAPGEAQGLLRALIGARADREPEAVAALVAQCCRLPLALRIAAELAAARRDTPLAALVADLADHTRRLDLLDADGDPRSAVRAVFSWSYRYLTADAARCFRLIGLCPALDLERYAAAALVGGDVEQAGDLLLELARAHLIHETGPARYSMHDLLRSYARELALAEDGEPERHKALTGLFDHLVHAATLAMNILYPGEAGRRTGETKPSSPTAAIRDASAAKAWLDRELPNLVAAAVHAEAGWPTHTTQLAAILFRYLDDGGRDTEAAAIYEHARRAAIETGDRDAEATASSNLGVLEWRHARYATAAAHFRHALTVAQAGGNPRGQCRALMNLGMVELRQGHYQAAADYFRSSLGRAREIGDVVGESRVLANLGGIELRLGRPAQATEYFQRALDLSRQSADRGDEAYALANLGLADDSSGRHLQAVARLNRALDLFHEIGDRPGQVDTLVRLGRAEFGLGRGEEAAAHLGQALAMARNDGHPDAEAEALNVLGRLSLAENRPELAAAHHEAALDLATRYCDEYERVVAHQGLAAAHAARGDRRQAKHHEHEASALLIRLGIPQAD